jgi:hypothetical protein
VQLELGGGEDAVDGLLEAAADVGELPGGDDFDRSEEEGSVLFGVADGDDLGLG